MRRYISATKEYSCLESFVSAPLLRKTFNITDEFKSVTVKIAVAGFYELYINGVDITKGFLAPYINNPDDYIYIDEYEISEYITAGENCMGIILGNGLMNNPGGHVWDFDKAPWRGAPRVAFEVYADGALLFEADEKVKTHPSAICFDDFRCGEYYDARKEIAEWSTVHFSDENWQNAVVLPSPKGEEKLCRVDAVKARKESRAVSITEYDGGYLYDFGENSTGVCKLSINNAYSGQQITVCHGEYLKNGKLDLNNIRFSDRGEFKNSFVQKSIYICSGKEREEHTPSFVYNGFRYAYVTGIDKEQATDELLTYIHFNSNLKSAGSFRCSDETVNAIQKMALNSAISCFVYFPNDCTQREKNGWTADVALSAEYTLLNFDAAESYKEWLNCVRKTQKENGILPGIIPTSGWGYGHGPAWDGVIVTLPYDIYRYTGDIEILEKNANAIRKYLNYLLELTDDRGIIDFGHGDWCDINDRMCGETFTSPRKFTSTVLAMYQFRCASQIFEILNRTEDSIWAKENVSRYRSTIRENMIDLESMTAIGNCETSQAMALYYGVFDTNEEPKAAKRLVEIIGEYDNFINCGVLGNKVLYTTLSKYGYSELAYKIITRPEFPSFGNLVKRGFTTLPEHFTTAEFEREYGEKSLNHHFWGNVTTWFYLCISGIQYNPYFTNLNYVEISPQFLKALSFTDAHINTKYGEISVNWKLKNDGNAELEISKPTNVRAKIIAPAGWCFEDGTTVKFFENNDIFKLYLHNNK